MSKSPDVDKALRKLKAYRQDGIDYKPADAASQYVGFKESPVLYYRVFDNNLRPVSDVVHAHSLDELHYMAIDNADRLSTLGHLLQIRPGFSPRTMTVADLILTAFVGTKDGKINTLLVAPYQGKSPYSLDTTLYAIAMSEMIPNSMGQPLRIALNVPSSMKKWSHLSKLSLFGSKISNPILMELNMGVNNEQILELRNDPEGCVRYSAKARAVLEQREADRLAATKGHSVDTDGEPLAETVVPISNGDAITKDVETEPNGVTETAEQSSGAELGEAVAVEPASAAAIPPTLQTRKSAVDTSSITGPLQAAKLEDTTHIIPDHSTLEANNSHPAFDTPAPKLDVQVEDGMFSNTKALLEQGEENKV